MVILFVKAAFEHEDAFSAEIDELNSIKDATHMCMFYVDLQGEVQRLQVGIQLKCLAHSLIALHNL